MNKTYNPKIDYLICKYLHDSDIDIWDEQLWKDMYNGRIIPIDKSQIIMLRAKKIFAYIRKKSTRFTLKSIVKCYELLTETKPELTDESYNILKQIVKMFKCDLSNETAEKSFITILKEKVFSKKWNVEMSKIIFNFIQIKKGLVPIIFYHYQTEQIITLIQENEIEGAMMEMKKAYLRTNHFNTKHPLIPLDSIISKMSNLKEILSSKYGVQEVFVYGSYAKEKYNEYSDLDLFIKVNNQKKEDLDNKYFLIEYLEEQLGISIDGKVNDINFKESDLKKDMRRYLKKIL